MGDELLENQDGDIPVIEIEEANGGTPSPVRAHAIAPPRGPRCDAPKYSNSHAFSRVIASVFLTSV